MPDCMGRPLRAGDRAAYGSTAKGLVIGTLLFNEDEKRSYHLDIGGRMYYPQKWARNGVDKNIINLTLYVEEENARL